MKKKTNVLVVLVLCISLFAGCGKAGVNSEESPGLEIVEEDSLVVYVVENDIRFLAVEIHMANNTKRDFDALYVQMVIEDEKIRSAMNEEKQFLLGGKLFPGEGRKYEIKRGKKLAVSATFNLHGEIDPAYLEDTIENQQSVKVNILDENKEVLVSSWVQNFKRVP